MRRTLDARHYHDEEPDLEQAPDGRLGRMAHRFADGLAGLIALAAAGAVVANIFFLQGPTLRSASTGATTVSVEPKARTASPGNLPGSPAMIFGPPSQGAQQAAPPPKAPVAAAPPPAPSAAAPAGSDGLAALLPPASLPAPKVPSPVVADIQRELARRGFYDGAVDGLSGPRTEAGVRAFEQAARLKVSSGEPTEAVLAELRRVPTVQAAPAPSTVSPAAPAASQVATRPPASAPAAMSAQPGTARAMLPPAAVPGDASVTGSVRPPGDVQAGSSRILAVQKALARLGYGPIKLDGQPGTETRLAVQRFERDRNLPVTGDISDRMVRELAAVSGTAIE
ncbi:MAG: peptidoglycan-binding domain-containing protein [Pseudomonadota bacterium]